MVLSYDNVYPDSDTPGGMALSSSSLRKHGVMRMLNTRVRVGSGEGLIACCARPRGKSGTSPSSLSLPSMRAECDRSDAGGVEGEHAQAGWATF